MTICDPFSNPELQGQGQYVMGVVYDALGVSCIEVRRVGGTTHPNTLYHPDVL